MATRNVVLTPRNEAMIEASVASGRYQNASEFLRDGLRLIEQREAENAAKLAALRAAVRHGEDDIAAGRFIDVDDPDALGAYLASLPPAADAAGE